MKKIDEYDYLLINNKFEESVDILETIAKFSLIKANKQNLENFIKDWNK